MSAWGARRHARGILLAAACLGTLGMTPPAAAQAPSADAKLEARLRRLEARVVELSTQLDRLAATPAPAPVRPKADRIVFGPGFAFSSGDDDYQWQFHDLTQVDARVFRQGGQNPVKDTFAIPRQWLMINGRLTKPIEYFASFAHGFGATTILDAFVNFHLDDRLQVKAGRFFVPFTYEPYVIPIHALITPEWSLFFNNFEPNRDLGVMAWGRLARGRLDYAAGVFNGSKNALFDTNSLKDVIGFVNAKPFREAGIPALENLNVGGSVLAGGESSAPNPRTLRTAVSIPGNATIGVPFLTFGDHVQESGARALWSLHAAYYYRQLSLIGEWDGGFQEYSAGPSAGRTRLPLRSFFFAAGYFLTGETVASRGVVQPLRPFDLRRGRFGLGAWELGARYNFLGIGDEVFSRGLADPNLWSNRVATVDVGLNWYLTPYVKVALFWEHAEFGAPVLVRPGVRHLTSDLVLTRLQLRF